MQADLFDIDEFIKINNLTKVTNPIVIDRDNTPTRDGLLSYEIFGRDIRNRKLVWGYVELHGNFFNPVVYKSLTKLDRRYEGIIAGTVYVKIDRLGDIITSDPSDEEAWTGIDRLYDNWEKIKLKKNESNSRNRKIDLIKSLKKSEIFVNKWHVCPPFYRDLQTGKSDMGKVSYGELTRLYSNLIRLAKSLSFIGGIAIVGNSTKNKIQKILIDIYTFNIGSSSSDYATTGVSGKYGSFRKFVLGKSIDYSARVIITAPDYNANKYYDNTVDFYTSSIPLAVVCSCFFPFIHSWIKKHFENNIEFRKKNYPIIDAKTGETRTVVLTNTSKFNDEYITKNIESYIKSYDHRFDTIPLENEENLDLYMVLSGTMSYGGKDYYEKSSSIINRLMTWTDLLYLAAMDTVSNKHMLITRYPLTDYFGTFPTKIFVATTQTTSEIIIDDVVYKHYPNVRLEATTKEVSGMFMDTIQMHNSYLMALGADYDGDQVTCKGAWSIEANEELDSIIKSKKNILNVFGESVRSTEREARQTLYTMTK